MPLLDDRIVWIYISIENVKRSRPYNPDREVFFDAAFSQVPPGEQYAPFWVLWLYIS